MNPPNAISAGKDVVEPFFTSVAFTLFRKAQHEIQPDLALLDEAERIRYQRYLNPQKRLEFLTGRTFLKHVIGEHLNVSPSTISLSLTATGKPYIARWLRDDIPHFNLSHTGGHYLIGLSNYLIGVDIEPYRPVDLGRFCHFLSSGEFGQLKALPEPKRSRLFIRLFTAKEAFLKATDKKWSLDTIQFELVSDRWQLTAPENLFQFTQLDEEGYCITVCVDTYVKHVVLESR